MPAMRLRGSHAPPISPSPHVLSGQPVDRFGAVEKLRDAFSLEWELTLHVQVLYICQPS